ncbi:MAG: SIMPL domain-containing protein [Bacteroidaceae bacterium]|nr:SIMPL domain-containing protein [Bacteroidaceae bacterium]
MKRISTLICIAAVTVIMALMPTDVAAQTTQQPYIDMQANVEREVTPDELYISITIKESDYKGKKSLADMQEAMLGVLKRNRIDVPECLTLDFMGSNVSYKIFSSRMIPKSQARYILKLNDAAIMQKIIYDLEDANISNIELEETKYTKEDELKTELGIEAMKKAQSQAIALAGAIGQEIGKAISINSWMSHNNPQPRLYKAARAMTTEEAAVDAAGVTPQAISISKLTYSVNVNVRFELK